MTHSCGRNTSDDFKMHHTRIDPRVLRRVKNKVLCANRSDLCKKLSPEKYYAELRQMGVFNADDEQEIRNRVTRTDKVSLLLDKLEPHDDAYDILIEVLKHIGTEQHVVQFLDRALSGLLEKEVPKYHGKVTSSDECLEDDDITSLPLPL